MSSDEEDFKVNRASHKTLLSEINDIVKYQHIKKPKRSEPSVKKDEFNLIKTKSLPNDESSTKKKSDKKSVSVQSLANIVRKNESQKKISNDFQNTFKEDKVLKKPLEKIHADRLNRNIAYDSAKTKLSRWDAVVTRNKNADQLKFPLNNDKAFIKEDQVNTLQFSQFRYKTKMIREIEEIHNECCPKSEDTSIQNNDSTTELLTLEEMRERRKELAKLKTRESHQMAKKRLQGKIKSKKYHRLKKREDLKKKLKEFEELKAVNPEAALKELEKIDKQRIQERVNLRHKNTGTWAKNMKVRAEYDTTAKQEIEAQLALSRELTQKQQKDTSDSESDEEEQIQTNLSTDNPWISGKNNDEDEIFSGYRKFWEEKNANEKAVKKLKQIDEKKVAKKSEDTKRSDEDLSENSISEDESIDSESKAQNDSKNDWLEEDIQSDNEDPSSFINDLFDKAEESINKKMESKLKELKPMLLSTATQKKRKLKEKLDVNDPKYLEIKRNARLADIDDALLEGDNQEENVNEHLPPSKKLMREIESIKDEKKAFMRGTKNEINPDSFLNVKSKHLLTAIPKTQELDDVDEEEMENLAAANKMSLAEAFENDDIIHDFVEDIEEETRSSQTPDSAILPGWGSWGGDGVKNKTKFQQKKFDVKKKDRVIVNTTPHESLRKHLVSKVPFPFTTIKDFEASMRIPIGKDFIPASAHSKLTLESIVTKAGTIIEPMTEEALVKTQENKKRNFMKHNKMKKKPFGIKSH